MVSSRRSGVTDKTKSEVKGGTGIIIFGSRFNSKIRTVCLYFLSIGSRTPCTSLDGTQTRRLMIVA